MEKIKALALIHVRAEGPVTFVNILQYVRFQGDEKTEPYQVAQALTELIREGKVCLYDDGVSFNCDEE